MAKEQQLIKDLESILDKMQNTRKEFIDKIDEHIYDIKQIRFRLKYG